MKSWTIMGRVAALAVMSALVVALGPAPVAGAVVAGGTEEEATRLETLTLEEAVQMALSSSRELREAAREVDRAQIRLEEASDAAAEALEATYNPETGFYLYQPGMSDPMVAVYQADFAWEQASRQLEVQKDTVAREVREKYYAVITAASAVELAKAELETAELALKVAEARWAARMETTVSVAAARLQKSQAEAALQQAEAQLGEAWEELALLLGKPVSWRAELSSRPAFTPLEVADPDSEIVRIVAESPGIWQAQKAVELQRKTYGLSNSEEYDELALESAYDNLSAATEQTTQALRSAYQNIRLMETSYANALAAVESAREALRVKELMCQVGLATRADVVSARANLAKAEDSLLSLAAQHELMVMAFYKPWTAAGGTAGAASGL